MSRIGKNPIAIPSGVEVQLMEDKFIAKGKLGSQELHVHPEVKVEIQDNMIKIFPRSGSTKGLSNITKQYWGTMTRRIINILRGVSEGFSVALDIVGVGYRAAVSGSNLVLNLGYSHDVIFPIPQGIKIVCEKPTRMVISGADKQQVGQIAAVIRAKRPPEPYKGKGIKYENEVIRRKESKKK